MAKRLVQLTTTQQCTASISPKDAKGNPATVESSVWTCSDETVATIVPSEDGLSCEIIGGAPGGARVVCNADTVTGEGKKPVFALVQVTVVAGQAATIDIECSDPVEQGSGGTEHPPRPGNVLPAPPSKPGQGLPGGKPPTGNRPDAGLPGAPNYPSTGVPPNVAGQPLPGTPPNKPDAGLPPAPEPKK